MTNLPEIPRPRLLVLTSTFPRWLGDTEPPFVFELSRRLTSRFAVTVLAPRAPGSLSAEDLAGLRVLRFPYFFRRGETLASQGGGILNRLRANRLNYLLAAPFLLGQWAALVRLLRSDTLGDQSFDLIHAHWLIPQGLAAVIGRRLAGRPLPLLTTSHGGDLYALRGALPRRLKSWVVQDSRRLTVVSEAMRSEVLALGADPARVSVIPMGVDLRSRFTPDPDVERATEELLFVGRLVEKKGLRILLQAMPRMLARRPGVTLKIAGAGPLESELKALALTLGVAERCLFLGMVPQSALPGLMRRAAVLVSPFLVARGGDQEGLGLTSVEAAGCECPVIAGDLLAVHDVITHDETGVLVPSGDPLALAEAVSALLDAPARRARLARAARQACLPRFDWEGIARRYGDLLDECLAPPRSGPLGTASPRPTAL